MFRTFLVAQRDPSPPDGYLECLRRVAELYRSRLVHAVVRDPEELPTPAVPPIAIAKECTTKEKPTGNGGERQSIVLFGDFVSAVCEKGHEADVIAVWHGCLVGPDGQPSIEELANLVRQAPRPVWVARDPLRFPEHILVAYDGSAHSGRALHMASNLAETVGARLTVLNVDESRDEVAQEMILSRAAGYCEAYRIQMERVGVFGGAAEAIRSYAESSQCDLLVVGAAGVGYLRGLLFGSVAGQLIGNAPCSVLVAK